MTQTTLYHDGCNICLEIESSFLQIVGNNSAFESVNLGLDPSRGAEAAQLGVTRLPSLVIDGKVIRIEDHSPIEHYLPAGSPRETAVPIAVYDTYFQRPDGRRMHFDILVPSDVPGHEQVLQYGRRYLESKGLASADLKAERCNYCHMETANSAVEQEIAEHGFAIIELEHCS